MGLFLFPVYTTKNPKNVIFSTPTLCFLTPTRTSRNQDVDIKNILKTPQWVRVQGVFFKEFYPLCVEFFSLVTTPKGFLRGLNGIKGQPVLSTSIKRIP
jgi:hypothetical protein